MHDLSNTEILSFEIGPDCNLKYMHLRCPINSRSYINKDFGPISTQDIIYGIKEAKTLNFNGLVAFHYYNEPLLYLDNILYIINKVRDANYLLWTNGVYLKDNIKDNEFLDKFEKVVITCYFKHMLPKFEALKSHYKNIIILERELDDRKNIYLKKNSNTLGCQRPVYGVNVDYWGNFHLCNRDYNSSYKLGNLKNDGLVTVINSKTYQDAVSAVYRRLLDLEGCPDICKQCDLPMPMPEIIKRFGKKVVED